MLQAGNIAGFIISGLSKLIVSHGAAALRFSCRYSQPIPDSPSPHAVIRHIGWRYNDPVPTIGGAGPDQVETVTLAYLSGHLN